MSSLVRNGHRQPTYLSCPPSRKLNTFLHLVRKIMLQRYPPLYLGCYVCLFLLAKF